MKMEASFDGVELASTEDLWLVWQFGAYPLEAAGYGQATPQAARATRMLLVLEKGVPPPSEEARVLMRQSFASSPVRAVAVVSGEDGFRGALIKGVLTGLRLLSRGRFQLQSFSSVGEAARWLGAQKAQGDDGDALALALEAHLRERRAARGR